VSAATNTTGDHIAVARAAVRVWREMGRPVIGAFIQGSAARNGYIARGSDLDVRIVVAGDDDPAWFTEQPYGSSVI
jgi:predicted nucleotidyltransferase